MDLEVAHLDESGSIVFILRFHRRGNTTKGIAISSSK